MIKFSNAGEPSSVRCVPRILFDRAILDEDERDVHFGGEVTGALFLLASLAAILLLLVALEYVRRE